MNECTLTATPSRRLTKNNRGRFSKGFLEKRRGRNREEKQKNEKKDKRKKKDRIEAVISIRSLRQIHRSSCQLYGIVYRTA